MTIYPTIPDAPRAIQKGVPLKHLLGQPAIECLAENILTVTDDFDRTGFVSLAMAGIEALTLMQRAKHIAQALHDHMPVKYSQAVKILVASFTPAKTQADEFGLAEMFYLIHSSFIAEYGVDAKYNAGKDPFEVSMEALYELTKRATSEFAIRAFLINDQRRTLAYIEPWLEDDDPHVRRLCSEGSRPRLPWGIRLKALVLDPQPVISILEKLKDDESLYVRRSVANHMGDIAKDHPELIFAMCDKWLQAGASVQLKWVIRHALRNPAKKANPQALALRALAKV